MMEGILEAGADKVRCWIEDTPFSCHCSICGAGRYGRPDDPDVCGCANHDAMREEV